MLRRISLIYQTMRFFAVAQNDIYFLYNILFVFFKDDKFAQEVVCNDNHNLTYYLCKDNADAEHVDKQPDNSVFHKKGKQSACGKADDFPYNTFKSVAFFGENPGSVGYVCKCNSDNPGDVVGGDFFKTKSVYTYCKRDKGNKECTAAKKQIQQAFLVFFVKWIEYVYKGKFHDFVKNIFFWFHFNLLI